MRDSTHYIRVEFSVAANAFLALFISSRFSQSTSDVGLLLVCCELLDVTSWYGENLWYSATSSSGWHIMFWLFQYLYCFLPWFYSANHLTLNYDILQHHWTMQIRQQLPLHLVPVALLSENFRLTKSKPGIYFYNVLLLLFWFRGDTKRSETNQLSELRAFHGVASNLSQ